MVPLAPGQTLLLNLPMEHVVVRLIGRDRTDRMKLFVLRHLVKVRNADRPDLTSFE